MGPTLKAFLEHAFEIEDFSFLNMHLRLKTSGIGRYYQTCVMFALLFSMRPTWIRTSFAFGSTVLGPSTHHHHPHGGGVASWMAASPENTKHTFTLKTKKAI